MTEEIQISITQLSYGMTPEELISEGYVDVDYFYDPDAEKWKKEIEKIQVIVEASQRSEEEYIEF